MGLSGAAQTYVEGRARLPSRHRRCVSFDAGHGRDLNGRHRARADTEDVERAHDAAVAKTSLFSEFWERHTTADERDWLQRLAQGPQVVSAPDAALRELTMGDYVTRDAHSHRIAVPLFQSWIEANQGPALDAHPPLLIARRCSSRPACEDRSQVLFVLDDCGLNEQDDAVARARLQGGIPDQELSP